MGRSYFPETKFVRTLSLFEQDFTLRDVLCSPRFDAILTVSAAKFKQLFWFSIYSPFKSAYSANESR